MKGLLAFVLVFVLAVAGLCVFEVEEQQREIDSFQQEIARQQRRMTNGTVVAANRLLRIQEFRRMTSVPYGVVVGDDFFWVKPLYPREGGVYIRLSRSNKETLRRFSYRKLVGVTYYPFRYVSLYSPPTERSNACKDSISGAFTFEAPEILILTFAKEEVDEDGPYVDYENALLVGEPFDRLIGAIDWAGRSFFRLDEVCDGRGQRQYASGELGEVPILDSVLLRHPYPEYSGLVSKLFGYESVPHYSRLSADVRRFQ